MAQSGYSLFLLHLLICNDQIRVFSHRLLWETGHCLNCMRWTLANCAELTASGKYWLNDWIRYFSFIGGSKYLALQTCDKKVCCSRLSSVRLINNIYNFFSDCRMYWFSPVFVIVALSKFYKTGYLVSPKLKMCVCVCVCVYFKMWHR